MVEICREPRFCVLTCDKITGKINTGDNNIGNNVPKKCSSYSYLSVSESTFWALFFGGKKSAEKKVPKKFP